MDKHIPQELSVSILSAALAAAATAAWAATLVTSLTHSPNASDAADFGFMLTHVAAAIPLYAVAIYRPKIALTIAALATIASLYGLFFGPGILWKMQCQFIAVPTIPALFARFAATNN